MLEAPPEVAQDRHARDPRQERLPPARSSRHHVEAHARAAVRRLPQQERRETLQMAALPRIDAFGGMHPAADKRLHLDDHEERSARRPQDDVRLGAPQSHVRAEELLAAVGLAGRGDDMAATMSGGERQRLAIARALLMKPPLLLCDEPTGNLDLETGRNVTDIFQRLHGEGLTIVAVTHEEMLAGAAERTVRLRGGRVVDPAAGDRAEGEG